MAKQKMSARAYGLIELSVESLASATLRSTTQFSPVTKNIVSLKSQIGLTQNKQIWPFLGCFIIENNLLNSTV